MSTNRDETLVTVEVNVPQWLLQLADESQIDLSEALCESLKIELGVNERV